MSYLFLREAFATCQTVLKFSLMSVCLGYRFNAKRISFSFFCLGCRETHFFSHSISCSSKNDCSSPRSVSRTNTFAYRLQFGLFTVLYFFLH